MIIFDIFTYIPCVGRQGAEIYSWCRRPWHFRRHDHRGDRSRERRGQSRGRRRREALVVTPYLLMDSFILI